MIEIIMVVVAGLTVTLQMAARKGRRYTKRRRGFIAIPFNAFLALSTLGDDTVLTEPMITFGEDIYIMSVDALWTIKGHTANEGPLQVGFNHGDLNATEVEEALEANLQDPDDIIAKEHARRPVRRAGTFAGNESHESLNHGVQIRTKLKFSVGETFALNAWCQNQAGATLTTGTTINIVGTIFGRWQR